MNNFVQLNKKLRTIFIFMKNTKFKSIRHVLIASTVLLSTVALMNTSLTVKADEQLNSIISSIDKSSETSVADGIKKLETRIQTVESENNKLKDEIAKLDGELTETADTIVKLNEQLSKQAKSAQTSSKETGSIVSTILDSKDLSQAISRITAMNTITSANQEKLKEFESKKEELETIQKQNQEKINQFESNIKELNEAKAELDALKARLHQENEAAIAAAEAEAARVRSYNGRVTNLSTATVPSVPSGQGAAITSPSSLANKHTGSGNQYPVGQCTWGTKQLANWAGTYWGNAIQWATSARAEGFNVGTTPVVGAIAVWTNSYYGHVGYVTAVNGSQIQVMESNYAGNMSIGNYRGWFNPAADGVTAYIYPPAS